MHWPPDKSPVKHIIYPTLDDLIAIQRAEVAKSGGSPGVRDLGILESAINRPRQSFGGEDLYPDFLNKAAALFESLIKNHPFIDGNKRTAAIILVTFIEINGTSFKASDEELEEFVVKVALGEANFEDIFQWLCRFCERQT